MRAYTVTVAPNDLSFALFMCLLHVGLVNTGYWVLFLAVCLFVFCPLSKVPSLCSRCEWLVAVGCREVARFLHSLCGWLGEVEWRADISAQGTWRPGSPYEALLKGQGGFWGNPTQLWLSLLLLHTLSHSFLYTHTPLVLSRVTECL